MKWLYYCEGKPSTAKLNRQLAFLVATSIVMCEAWKGSLSTEIFGIYITVFTGFELGQNWQRNKDDKSGAAIRPLDETPGRDSSAAVEWSGTTSEGKQSIRKSRLSASGKSRD